MKLEELLKDSPDVLKAVTDAIAKVNEDKTDKLEHVRFVDLSEGEYVSKAKYTALDAENQTNTAKLTEANKLLQQLQKGVKGDEDFQGQVTDYQTKVKDLEKELVKTKIDAAIKVGLLAENVVDLDYVKFKMSEKGEEFELDEHGKIKGWDDKIASIKTQLPGQFETGGKGSYDGFRPMDKSDQNRGRNEGMTKEELLKKPYAEQVKFFNENPDAYNEIMKG